MSSTGPLVPVDVDAFLPAAAPEEVLSRATSRARALMKVVRDRKLSIRLGQEEYLRFEAWQLLGAFYGITAVVTGLEEERDEDGRLIRARARAEARWRGSLVLGAAESECSREEELTVRQTGERKKRWEQATDAQIKGMAQTRACARALRQCLGWVARLAGFEPGVAEEVDQLDLVQPQSTPRGVERQERR